MLHYTSLAVYHRESLLQRGSFDFSFTVSYLVVYFVIHCNYYAQQWAPLIGSIKYLYLYQILDISVPGQLGTDHNCLVLINCQYFGTSRSLIYDPRVDGCVFDSSSVDRCRR